MIAASEETTISTAAILGGLPESWCKDSKPSAIRYDFCLRAQTRKYSGFSASPQVGFLRIFIDFRRAHSSLPRQLIRSTLAESAIAGAAAETRSGHQHTKSSTLTILSTAGLCQAGK